MNIKSILSWRVLIVGLALVPSAQVFANPGPIAEILCAPKAQMQQRLETEFRSRRAWQGLRSPEEVMEIWEDQRGDWTMTISYSEGHLCIVAMGSGLMTLSEAEF